jgi:carboxypeptidase C (cathepsin A)
LKYGKNQTYKPNNYGDGAWDLRHHAPNGPPAGYAEGGLNVMPDLATAMKLNPKMRILVTGGYFDLATPFYEGVYEMHHLPIPLDLQKNISYQYYESGHMVYLNETTLSHFHDDVVKFVRETESGK